MSDNSSWWERWKDVIEILGVLFAIALGIANFIHADHRSDKTEERLEDLDERTQTNDIAGVVDQFWVAPNDPDRVIASVKRLLQTYPGDQRLLTLRGYIELQQASYSLTSAAYEKAEASFKAALQEESDSIQALIGLGRVHLASGDITAAIEKFERASELATQDLVTRAGRYNLLCLLGRAYMDLRELDTARDYLQQASELEEGDEETETDDLKDATVYKLLAQLSRLEGAYADAIENYDKAVVLDPDNPTLLDGYVEALVFGGQLEETLGEYELLLSSSDQVYFEPHIVNVVLAGYQRLGYEDRASELRSKVKELTLKSEYFKSPDLEGQGNGLL